MSRRIHIAIMRKSWGLTKKILTGEKTIESRWSMNHCSPWGKIEAGDTVYFKDSGEPVTIRATVEKVLPFADLTPVKVEEILDQYGRMDGLGVERENIDRYFEMFKNKRYCLLIFLKDAVEVEPFEIDKTGFGAMSAWLTTDDLSKITLKFSPAQSYN